MKFLVGRMGYAWMWGRACAVSDRSFQGGMRKDLEGSLMMLFLVFFFLFWVDSGGGLDFSVGFFLVIFLSRL